MTSDGGFTLPAGTVSMLMAHPAAPGGLPGQAVVAAASAHSGAMLADRQSGDGDQVTVFARASDAAACALAVQRTLAAEAVPAGIAVHTSQAGQASYPGPGLDRCAALARVARAGQSLLSQASAGLVADSLPAGADLSDLGWHRLADLGPAEHVWQLGHPDVPAAFPPLRSLSAYRHNLPVELTSFVPRDTELAELTALITEARLVTLTGSGGCGKTRLALHSAAGRVGAHADGVWLAELAALRDPGQVAASIADVLPLGRRGPDGRAADLAAAIGTSELLLVLDNCGHLIRSCAEVADCLLRADYDNIRGALSWASRHDDPELLLGLVTRLVVFWSASTHLAEAVQWLRTATERGRDADPGLRARALGALTQIASLALNLDLAFAAGTEGLAVLRQLGDNEGTIVTLTSLGSSATLMGEPGADRPYLDEAIALAEQIGDQRALAYALAVRGRAATMFPADRPAGREALRRSIELARQCGARHVEGIALGVLGVLSSLDGYPQDAIPPLTEALPLLREAGDVFFLSLTLSGLVQSLSLAGDYDAALVPCQELDAISSQLGAAQLYFAPYARGYAAYSRGDWPEAIRCFREQLTFATPIRMGGMWVGHLAWAEFLAGQAQTARRRLDEFIASTDPARTSLALPWAIRALIAQTDGEHELAAELARQAVAAAPDDPFSQSTVLKCLAVMAEVQAHEGQHELTVRLAAAIAAFVDRSSEPRS